ncbi:hypothetical protein [Oceanobacillus sojae]
MASAHSGMVTGHGGFSGSILLLML